MSLPTNRSTAGPSRGASGPGSGRGSTRSVEATREAIGRVDVTRMRALVVMAWSSSTNSAISSGLVSSIPSSTSTPSPSSSARLSVINSESPGAVSGARIAMASATIWVTPAGVTGTHTEVPAPHTAWRAMRVLPTPGDPTRAATRCVTRSERTWASTSRRPRQGGSIYSGYLSADMSEITDADWTWPRAH